MAKTLRQRARNIGDADIEIIVGILDGWTDKLTWDALINAAERRLRARYTRQALHQHTRIKQAFQLTKERLTGTPPVTGQDSAKLGPAEAQALVDRYEKLAAENIRLKLENERLLEQFVVWAYNAHTRGLDKEFLNRPLPQVNRDQTKIKHNKNHHNP